MTHTKHDEEIIPQVTYGQAAAAVAARVLQQHGLPDNSHVFNEADTYDRLVRMCDFLPESIDSGTPQETLEDPAMTLNLIVDFVHADLYQEQLAMLAQAVIPIAAAATQKPETLVDLLDMMRSAADSIDDGATDEECRAANLQAKNALAVAMLHAQPVVEALDDIRRNAASIDLTSDPATNRTYNQVAQGNILVSLEKLAFALNQDEWAHQHGFQKPAQPNREPAVS